MAAVGHFGCPKFTIDCISGHFRSIRNFIFFWNFDIMDAPAILDVRNSLSIAFLAISDRYTTLFLFAFRGHFRSIQIFFVFKFLTTWPAADILDIRKLLSMVYAVVSNIQGLWKIWVDFCKYIFYTYLGHNFCKKCGWHFFGSHLGYLAAILNVIIFWTLFSINQLLLSKLLLLTSLYLMYFMLIHNK